MIPPQLLYSTHNPVIDRLVHGIVGLFEHVFPQRVSGYYLLGSYANGSALPSSDLDMVMLFTDRFVSQHEFATAVAINESCKLFSPVPFDAWVISDERTRQPAFIGDTLELKLTGRLIYGTDTRHQITACPDADYVRWAMDVPVYPITVARTSSGSVTTPLSYPDPHGRFYGYDQWSLRLSSGDDMPGTKLLVATVGRIAAALLAYQHGIYVGSKRDCVEQYCRVIHDEWSDLVSDVYAFCRNKWGYRIPEHDQAQTHLRSLCQQALGFENHFVHVYQEHLIREVQQGDPDHQAAAIDRLGQIIYPDQAVIDALEGLTGERRVQAHAVIDRIRQHTARASA